MEPPSAKTRHEIAAELAHSRGFSYRPVNELSADHLDDAIGRLLALANSNEDPSSAAAAAVMGLTEAPRRSLMEMAEEMANLFPGEVSSKTDAQASVWRAKWKRVAKRMVDYLGENRAIDDLREEDAMGLVAELQKKVDVRDLTAESANKDIAFLNRMIREHHRLLNRPKLVNLFHGHRTKKPVGRKRMKKPAVPLEYLELWLMPDAWGAINDQVRDISLIAMETGCRASEIYNLPPEAIQLNAPIPHILIAFEEEGVYKRELKTEASDREIPLVGVALEAMKRNPHGFPRYRGNRNFNNTANKSMRDIGLFRIVSESSVGAGVRRIEAVTGRGAQQLVQRRLRVLDDAATHLGARPEEVDRVVLRLMGELHDRQKEIAELRRDLARMEFERLLEQTQSVDGVQVLASRVEASDMDTLREMTDWLRNRLGSVVIVLGAVIDGKPNFVAAVTPDLVERGLKAGNVIRQVARIVGGGGGGRATLAQAGGRDPGRLDEALALVPQVVGEMLDA